MFLPGVLGIMALVLQVDKVQSISCLEYVPGEFGRFSVGNTVKLRNCILDKPLRHAPLEVNGVEFYNVSFPSEVNWESLLPMTQKQGNALIFDRVEFADEETLGKLPMGNVGSITVVHSNLKKIPFFLSLGNKSCILRRLDFSNNAIRRVPKEIIDHLYINCKALCDFDIRNNSLSIFPEINPQTVTKKRLYLEGNPLDCGKNDHLVTNQRLRDMLLTTPDCKTHNQSQLVKFWFHDHALCATCDCFIRSDVYVNCARRNLGRLPNNLPRETTHLDVSGNNLKSLGIPNNPLDQSVYSNIKYLNASHNSIERIDDYDPGICNLIILDVSHNNLTSFSQILVKKLVDITRCRPLLTMGRINLGNNPWRCDCDLLPLKHYLGVKAREIDDFASLQCDGDQDGRSLWAVSENQLCPPPAYEINSWDISIGFMVLAISSILYKTMRDYHLQKQTGKLPDFFKL